MDTDWVPPEEFDDYVIDRPLGSGRTGRVYLAQDAVLARPVAVKFIADLDPDIATRQRFLLEARAVARIHHPNVISIYRVGELDQKPYIITEFVRGQTLDQLDKPVAREPLRPIAIALARGLAAAHRRGVVHGDVKPGNAILSDDGTTKLLDFGFAAVVEDTAVPGGNTHGVAGTPDYMAPEVWRDGAGRPRAPTSTRSAPCCTSWPPGTTPSPRHPRPDLPRLVQDRDAPSLAGAPGVDARLRGDRGPLPARDPGAPVRLGRRAARRARGPGAREHGRADAGRQPVPRAAPVRGRPPRALLRPRRARSARSSTACAPSRSSGRHRRAPARASRRCAAPASCPRSPTARSAGPDLDGRAPPARPPAAARAGRRARRRARRRRGRRPSSS